MTVRIELMACLIAAVTLPSAAAAQATLCRLPERIPAAEAETPPPGEARNIRPTQYLMALSWSPQFCKSRSNDPKQAFQCSGEVGKFGFILHGLWPDIDGRDDPAWCGPAKPLSADLLRRNLCMMPSPHLMQHEWAKHGTCASRDPEKYFKAAGLLFNALKFPDMDTLSRRRITVASFTAAFSGLNPGIRPDMIAVNTDKGGWLKEIRICLDVNLKPKSCAREDWGTNPNRFVKIWRAE
jgi:ribonuclease T2